MKKVLFIASAFLSMSPVFSQTEKKATETVPVKTEKKAAAKKEVKATSAKAVKAEATTVKAPETKETTTTLAQPQQVTPPPPAAPPADVNKLFEFKNEAFDFGKIPAGKPAKYDLFIKNISKETAELTLVQPGCGCTTPEYEAKKKFALGETVKVTLGYNGGAPGNGSPFSKSVTVTLNGNVTKVVTFKGETYAVPTESAPANGSIDKLKPAEETKH